MNKWQNVSSQINVRFVYLQFLNSLQPSPLRANPTPQRHPVRYAAGRMQLPPMDRSSRPITLSHLPRLSQTTIPHNFIENHSPVTGALLSIPSLHHLSTSAFPEMVPHPLQGVSAEDEASQQTQAGKGTAEKYLSISLPDMNGTARNISDNLLLTGSYGESSRRSFPRNDRKIRLSSGKRAYFKPCLTARWEPLIML